LPASAAARGLRHRGVDPSIDCFNLQGVSSQKTSVAKSDAGTKRCRYTKRRRHQMIQAPKGSGTKKWRPATIEGSNDLF
jgi:hypothetical protein